jgi:hypothetical protein
LHLPSQQSRGNIVSVEALYRREAATRRQQCCFCSGIRSSSGQAFTTARSKARAATHDSRDIDVGRHEERHNGVHCARCTHALPKWRTAHGRGFLMRLSLSTYMETVRDVSRTRLTFERRQLGKRLIRCSLAGVSGRIDELIETPMQVDRDSLFDAHVPTIGIFGVVLKANHIAVS